MRLGDNRLPQTENPIQQRSRHAKHSPIPVALLRPFIRKDHILRQFELHCTLVRCLPRRPIRQCNAGFGFFSPVPLGMRCFFESGHDGVQRDDAASDHRDAHGASRDIAERNHGRAGIVSQLECWRLGLPAGRSCAIRVNTSVVTQTSLSDHSRVMRAP